MPCLDISLSVRRSMSKSGTIMKKNDDPSRDGGNTKKFASVQMNAVVGGKRGRLTQKADAGGAAAA